MKDLDQAASCGAGAPLQVQAPLRVGLLGFAELRREGFAAILCGKDVQPCYELVPLTAETALRTAALDVLMIEGEEAGPLPALLGMLRRARPQLRMLVVGHPVDHAAMAGLISAGAKGYLFLSAPPDEILTALAVVRDNSIWAPRKVLASLLDLALDSAAEARREAEPEPVRFTAREREVLRLLVLGFPNRAIAAAMQVDGSTVKAHLSRLMRKARVRNRIALSVKAIERNWT